VCVESPAMLLFSLLPLSACSPCRSLKNGCAWDIFARLQVLESGLVFGVQTFVVQPRY